MMDDWPARAAELTAAVAHSGSRWRPAIAATPRHLFVPRWWRHLDGTWLRRDGATDLTRWASAAYSDLSLVTSVAGRHADHASADEHPAGSPTSSATMPGLLVRMYQHALIQDGQDVLDVGAGSGYGTALLCHRVGDQHVTSIDIDPYLCDIAAARLAAIDQHPQLLAIDATGPLPGEHDRIVATVAVPTVPASWLAALRVGGRLVTTLTNCPVIITADKQPDGFARGRVEWDRAGFMLARHTAGDYPPGLEARFEEIREAEAEGESIAAGRYPVVDVNEAWELLSNYSIVCPGVEHRYSEHDGRRTAWMVHPDGSWARATSEPDHAPVVRQGGPRRLWDVLDQLRTRWLTDGQLPLHGAQVHISPDGHMELTRGGWSTRLSGDQAVPPDRVTG